MSYDLELVRTAADESALDALLRESDDEAATDPGGGPPALRLTERQLLGWESICVGVVELAGPADREESPSYVAITSREPRVRLEYRGDSATIEIPRWYEGDAAQDVLATAYAVGRVVEEQTGLTGLDVQTGLGLQVDHVPAAVDAYTGTRSAVLRAVEGSPSEDDHRG